MRPTQSPAASFAEAAANVLVGYVLALLVQQLAYPAFGITTSLSTNALLAMLFTLVSLTRSFLLRRVFEHLSR